VATLLSVLQDACDFGGFPRPTSIINNTDATTRQLLAIANERGIEAVRMFDWPQLTKLSSLSLVAGTNQTLPADCAELLDSTAWYTGDMTPIRGPITPREWQALTQTGNAGIKFAFRVSQNSKGARAVAMHPTPVGNETISLFYRSKTWIKPQEWVAAMSVTAGMWVFSDGEYWTANTSGTAGTSAPTIANNGVDGTITWTRKANVLYERFIADTDEPLIESSILMKGILARFYRMKGLEYQDLEAEFNIGLRNDLAERNGGRTSNIFRYNCGFLDTECRDVGFIGGASSSVTPVVPTVPTDLLPYAIGLNTNGQLGDGTGFDAPITRAISFVNEYAKVSAGERNTLFIKTNGTMYSCGRNVGAIGNGSFADVSVTPPVQIGTGFLWTDVSCGYQYGLAVRQDGTLWAWGRTDPSGVTRSLGDGTTTASASLIQIGTDTNWSKVYAGELHSMAIKTDGTLWAWGSNVYGYLGDGTTVSKNSPVQVGVDTNWASVALGDRHSLGIKTNGTLWAWGYNNASQLGDNTTTDRLVPTQIGTGTNWKSVAAGYFHSIGLKTDGTLWSWGYGANSALGQGNTTTYLVPTQIGTATDWDILASSKGGTNHHHAVKTSGAIYGWGANNNYNLGDGTSTTRAAPVLISAPLNTIHIANGYYHTMFLVDSGA
jgi:alpha-tubulin suppressor-like RCC1 family protein